MKRYIYGAFFCLVWYFPATTLLAKTSDTTNTSATIPARLGWIATPGSENLCCGYYADPLADFGDDPLPELTTTPIAINAAKGTFHETGTSLLQGKVSLAQPGRLANAEQILIHLNPAQSQTETADLSGNVTLREPGKFIVGDSAQLALHSKVAQFMHALYRLALTPMHLLAKDQATQPLSAWGKADSIAQNKQGLITLEKATYTTCAPTANSWQVNADTIVLDRANGRGYAHNAWLKVKNIPVFYTPYFNFPIDNRRASGFLFPTFGTSTTAGFNFTVPYYWNIAPNYDAIITPHIYAKRGVQLNSTVRYLTATSTGDFSGSYLPDDQAFKNFRSTAVTNFAGNPNLGRLTHTSTNRSALALHDLTNLDQHWQAKINYNSVSDDYYLQDFNDVNTVTNNQLLQAADLDYNGDNWNFQAILQQFQTLHPVNQASVNNPYSTLPQLNWNGNYPATASGFAYQFNNQFTYFTRAANPGEITPVPNAARLNLQPGISLPLNSLAGYFTPTLQLAMTHYNVGSQVPGFAAAIQRTVPIFNIDSGLYLARATQLFGTDFQQTLEPRLFYLYTPYRNQNAIPVFDTGIVPFSYDSLFMTNRFSGLDRIGDADQIAYALTTRFLAADTGAEKFRASIGQLYYFQDRRVNLCNPGAALGTTPSTAANYGGCSIDPTLAIGATSSTEKFSPIAGQLAYHFNPALSIGANAAWDPSRNETINAGTNIQYRPAVNHLINLNYNYIRYGDIAPALAQQPAVDPSSHVNDLNQATFSFAWPVRERWNAVGGYTYNISHEYPQTYFYGLEYGSCCWAVRLVAGRMFTSLNQNNNPTFNNMIYLQWELKGLATLGTEDPSSFLLSNIPGYQNQFQPFQGSSL